MSSPISRERSREIIISCFSQYTQNPIPNTPEGESISIQGTLQRLPDVDRQNIWRCIVSKIEGDGCTTELGIGKFITASYTTVGSIVGEAMNWSEC